MKAKRDKGMQTKKFPTEVWAFGYVRKDDDYYTAICVNLGLFAQANNPLNAIARVISLARAHCEYVKKHHPKEWEKYLFQPLPDEYIKEFEGILTSMVKAAKFQETKPQNTAQASLSSTTQRISAFTFREEVPAAYAH